MANDEAQRYMKAISAESVGGHPTDEQLIAYNQCSLADADRDRVQAHLVSCDLCLDLFRHVSEFFEPPRGSEELPGEIEIRREWQTFRKRFESEFDRPARPALAPGAFRTKILVALAACLVLAIALPLTYFVWVQHQQIRELELAQRGWAERLNQLEAENQRLQQERSELQGMQEQNRQLQEQIAALRQESASRQPGSLEPQLNVALFDLLPQHLVERSGGARDSNRINLSGTAGSIALILNAADIETHSSYRIEISDRDSRIIWKSAGLRRSTDGNFIVSFGRNFFKPGQYVLKIYGGSGDKVLAEYQASITTR